MDLKMYQKWNNLFLNSIVRLIQMKEMTEMKSFSVLFVLTGERAEQYRQFQILFINQITQRCCIR